MSYSNNPRSLLDWAKMHTNTWAKGGVTASVKWEPNSDCGWMVCGDNWFNVQRGLEFPITKYQLITEGWELISVPLT